MKIDITSMFFNSSVKGTATAAWRTSIGQNNKKKCKIETDVPGVTDVVVGILHLLKDDFTSKSHMTRGGNNDELLVSSVFDKVYVNGIHVENCKYVLSIVREHTASHDGRKELCYSPNLCYGDISNSVAIKLIANALGCTEEGCWFVYDISVINQDELHFSAVVVNQNSPTNYNFGGAERSKIWNALVADELRKSNAGRIGAKNSSFPNELPLQQIFYGAPGTGKSDGIKRLEKYFSEVIRTTFHPDSDYATFVGAYKPVMKKVRKCVVIGKEESEIKASVTKDDYEEKISYSFVKQAFLKAYISAWKGLNEQKNVLLVIEEINRGNCAQIFGDLFQLLDRETEGENRGYSTYPIVTDEDLREVLAEDFKDIESIPENVKSGENLLLPPNLYIWATMNTSDQSLFPIDSAFKRRWDWVYKPIKYDNKDWKVVLADGSWCKWTELQQTLNDLIYDATESEDKMLGDWFVKAEKDEISEEVLVGKIIFYLWNDVAKVDAGKLFDLEVEKRGRKGKVIFSDFYEVSGDINSDVVKSWLKNIEVTVTEKTI